MKKGTTLVLCGLLGCGGDDTNGPGGTGGFIDAGPSIDGDVTDATPNPDAAVNVDGPVVEILSPVTPASGDFSSDAILTDSSVEVVCSAMPNPTSEALVDTTSVEISIAANGNVFTAPAIPTGSTNEFSANLNLDGVDNGAVEVRCSASDLTAEPITNSDSVNTFLDNGPNIQVLSPVANTSYANAVDVSFSVIASPVAMADTLADPDTDGVVVSVGGTVVSGVAFDQGQFSVTINFQDPIFSPALDGPQQLSIVAQNVRTTAAVAREELVPFVVDSSGPEIFIVKPAPGALVSAIMTIEATVADNAGILQGSTVATIAGIHEVSLTDNGAGAFTGNFDTRILGTNMVFPNVIVRAQDSTGNQSSSGRVVTLDNVAPQLSLDSPDIREAVVNDGALVCSALFDPLGTDSVDDGETITQLFEIRARIEDSGNGANSNSGVAIPIANTDQTSVQLFLLDDSSEALIVDTDGDGTCDDINPHLVPTSVPVATDEVAVIDMVAIPEAGASDFLASVNDFASTGHDSCTAGELLISNPNVCNTVSTSRIIRRETSSVPVIYGVAPLTGSACMGFGIDALATNLSDGWTCAAVRGSDNLGNISVSAPLRMCIDSNLDEVECPTVGTITSTGLDDCTGTYDPLTDTVDGATDCTLPETFEIDLRRIDL